MTVLTLHTDATGQFEAVDPIVSPGVGVKSAHEHTFYAAKNITSDSTPDTLRVGETVAGTTGDTAGLWVPTLYWDGKPVRGKGLHAGEYWLAPAKVKVEAPPAGMCFVAGNGHAMDPSEQFPGQVMWHAQQDSNKRTAPYDCSNDGKGPLKYEVFFPDCWDGTVADPATGKIAPSHFAYTVGGNNPPGFPHRIAQLGFQIDLVTDTGAKIYDPFDAQGNVRITFSSGPWYTAHADFMNGWDQDKLGHLIDGCLNKTEACPPHV